jgi:hypothetical protein
MGKDILGRPPAVIDLIRVGPDGSVFIHGETADLERLVVENAETEPIGHVSPKFGHVCPPGNVGSDEESGIIDITLRKAAAAVVVILHAVGEVLLTGSLLNLTPYAVRRDGRGWI